eukprot:c14822_g1_i1 orf=35-343(+)
MINSKQSQMRYYRDNCRQGTASFDSIRQIRIFQSSTLIGLSFFRVFIVPIFDISNKIDAETVYKMDSPCKLGNKVINSQFTVPANSLSSLYSILVNVIRFNS